MMKEDLMLQGNESGVKHIKPMIALISTFSFVFTGAFEMCVYQYYRGYYDFWNIPDMFIEIDYKDIIYRLVNILAVVALLIIVTNIFWSYYDRIRKRMKKIIIAATAIAGVFILSSVFFIAYVCLDVGRMISLPEIVEILPYIVETAVLLTIGITGLGLTCHINITKGPDEKRTKNSHKIGRIASRRYILTGLGFILFAVIIGWNMIYSSGKDAAACRDSISIVNAEQRSYVIVDIYDGKYLMKECSYVTEGAATLPDGFRICRSNYMICGMTDENVTVYELESNDISNYMTK